MNKLHEESTICMILIIGAVCIIAACRLLSWNEMRIRGIDIREAQEIDTKDGAEFAIDEAYCTAEGYDNRLIISGWCAVRGKETRPVSIHVLFKNDESGKYIQLPTTVITRTDVTEWFNDGINYDNAGFRTTCILHKNETYMNREIILLYEIGEEKFLISTGKYLEMR